MGDTSKLGFDYPDVVIHGAEVTAPAAATVLADSGAVGVAGKWRFRVVGSTTDTANNLLEIAHRNAANSADLELAAVQSGNNTQPTVDCLFTLAVNERVVVRNKNAGTAALFYHADLYGWFIP